MIGVVAIMEFEVSISKGKKQNKIKEKKVKEKKEFSWGLAVLIWAHLLAGAVSIFTMVMCAYTGDFTSLAYLIPAVFVDASAITAVVLWKRKHENVIAFLSNEKFKKAIEWLKTKDVDPAEFIRVLKE